VQIFTLNVGQGQFVVVTGDTDAIIIDTFVPLNAQQTTEYVKGALANILYGKNLVGLIVTGLDADHLNEVGLKLVLNKYNPAWIMYPQYFKRTDTAESCFKNIAAKAGLVRHAINLATNPVRGWNLGTNFDLETFSPHPDDMNSSNNCSLVCKITEKGSWASYLVTGDTEQSRWNSIVKFYSGSLKSDVLAAPHHGSDNGINEVAMNYIRPDTVLISAGVGNQWGHPEKGAMAIFKRYSVNQWSTNWDTNGQSLQTSITGSFLARTVKTVKY
jgi:competence protein ComEC